METEVAPLTIGSQAGTKRPSKSAVAVPPSKTKNWSIVENPLPVVVPKPGISRVIGAPPSVCMTTGGRFLGRKTESALAIGSLVLGELIKLSGA